jgi:uncharacterized protein (DUF983 family)
MSARPLFIPFQVSDIVGSLRTGEAFTTMCPACGRPYLYVAVTKISYAKPCPDCGRALDSMGCIGIDQAVAIIAANRTGEARR